MKKTFYFIAMGIICFALSACTQDPHYQNYEHSDNNLATRENNEQQSPKQRSLSYNLPDSNIRAHKNQSMELSQATANELMKIRGLNQTFVILTDHNAYVAVTMDNRATGISGDGKSKRLRQPQMLGAERNLLNSNKPDQDPGYPYNDLYSHYTGADYPNISNKLMEKIGTIVRELNPQVQRVYISSDPDFFNQLHRYNQTAAQGKPLKPYLDDFNRTVSRLFTTK